MLKEPLHIQMTPADEHFNLDRGLELPGCWFMTLKTMECGGGCHRPPVMYILGMATWVQQVVGILH